MSDQILSQEEIDALLGAMAEGEVDLEEDKKGEPEFQPYDLTSQSIMLRDQFYALEEVYDKYANLLQTSISSSLQRSINVEFMAMEMAKVKFGKYIKSFPNPTSFNIFSMEPLVGSALLAIEPDLVFSLIDCMFGGSGKPPAEVREFTLIEQRMMRRFVVEVLKNLEKACRNSCSPTGCACLTATLLAHLCPTSSQTKAYGSLPGFSIRKPAMAPTTSPTSVCPHGQAGHLPWAGTTICGNG